MATCANCIHHSLCDYNTNISGNGKVRLVYADGADAKCSFFQNTADVVPKSEVERLRKALDEYEETSGLKQAKAEVASEIFNDIACMCILQHGFNENHIVAHIDFELLKELKKKYTGDQT